MIGIEYREHFSGTNMFTPVVIEYGKTKDSFYELSSSRGNDTLSGQKLWGVTVASGEGSECFHDLGEARAHIEKLKGY